MTSPRLALATAIKAAGGADLTVWSEEPAAPPSLPAVIVRPDTPYRVPASGITPNRAGWCVESWRLVAAAYVPVDTIAPLTDLDDLIALIRAAIDAVPVEYAARYRGVRAAGGQETIAGKTMRAALVEVEMVQ